MGRIRKEAARKVALPKVDQKTPEERQHIAEQGRNEQCERGRSESIGARQQEYSPTI